MLIKILTWFGFLYETDRANLDEGIAIIKRYFLTGAVVSVEATRHLAKCLCMATLPVTEALEYMVEPLEKPASKRLVEAAKNQKVIPKRDDDGASPSVEVYEKDGKHFMKVAPTALIISKRVEAKLLHFIALYAFSTFGNQGAAKDPDFPLPIATCNVLKDHGAFASALTEAALLARSQKKVTIASVATAVENNLNNPDIRNPEFKSAVQEISVPHSGAHICGINVFKLVEFFKALFRGKWQGPKLLPKPKIASEAVRLEKEPFSLHKALRLPCPGTLL